LRRVRRMVVAPDVLFGPEYEVPRGEYEAYPWSPELFVRFIRKIVLECHGFPMIRTRVSGGRRITYNGTSAIYLICWGGDPSCKTVVFYNVPEDLWWYMDSREGEWRDLYRRFVLQLYGKLTDLDYRVLGVSEAYGLEGER